MRQGAVGEGRLELFANVDLAKALGLSGLIFHANAYQIHGEGLTSHYLGNLITVSNIEAPPSTRLFDLWLQQSLFDDTVSLRVGQIAADDEFFVSQYAPLFISSTFGWPAIMGINLPSGGPAYPVARPGARARVALSSDVSLQAACSAATARSIPPASTSKPMATCSPSASWPTAPNCSTCPPPEAGRLDSYRPVHRPAFRYHASVSGRSGFQCHPGRASRRLWRLFHHRPAVVAQGRRQRHRPRRLPAGRRQSVATQPDRAAYGRRPQPMPGLSGATATQSASG